MMARWLPNERQNLPVFPIIRVVVLPVTSIDTAFRSSRFILSGGYPQIPLDRNASFLFVFLALPPYAATQEIGFQPALTLVPEAIGIGAAVGLDLTAAGACIIKRCSQRNRITQTWGQPERRQ